MSTFREIMNTVIQSGKEFFSQSKSKQRGRLDENTTRFNENMKETLDFNLMKQGQKNFFKKNYVSKQIETENHHYSPDDQFNEYIQSKNTNGFFKTKWKADYGPTKNIKALKIREDQLMFNPNTKALQNFKKQNDKMMEMDNNLGNFFNASKDVIFKPEAKKKLVPTKKLYGKIPAMTPLHSSRKISDISNDFKQIKNPSQISTSKIPKSPIHLPKEWSMDDFEIGRSIGRGRFGHVYLAKEKKSGFIVALKIMKIEQILKDESQYLLRREIEVQSQLKHRNILRCYGYFWDENIICFILEYASEGELYQHLKAQPKRRFSEKRTAFFLSQIISAFKYLHSKNILHRDLKVYSNLTKSPKIF